MAKYKVYAGLGSGEKYIETVEVASKEEAAKSLGGLQRRA